MLTYLPSSKQPDPTAYESLSIGAVAVSLTASLVTNANIIRVRFEDGPIRFRIDGMDPTPTEGLFAFDGDERILLNTEAAKLKMIRTGATNGTARVVYYSAAQVK